MAQDQQDTRREVLHALRLKGTADAATVAEVSGTSVDVVESALRELSETNLAEYREGRRAGFRLTDDGRRGHAELLKDSLSPEQRAAVEELYTAFLPLNGRLKDVCGEWQIRDGEPNDHQDAAYDADVVSKLRSLHEDASHALRGAGAYSSRYLVFDARLSDALTRVEAGEAAAFARPMARSYHDAWMELHQDLLLTLERQRDAADGH